MLSTQVDQIKFNEPTGKPKNRHETVQQLQQRGTVCATSRASKTMKISRFNLLQ